MTQYKTVFIENLNDVIPHVLNNKKDKIKFIFDGEFDDLAIEMIQAKYIPDVIFKDSALKGLKFKIMGIEYIIQHSNMASDCVHNIDEEELQLYNERNNNISKWLINKEFLSKFNDETKTILEEYSTNPLIATFEQTKDNLISIDHNKAYTSCFVEMSMIPTFNIFDSFMVYDDHAIDEFTYYLVEFEDDSIKIKILTSKKVCVLFGYILKRCSLKFSILKYLRPSNLKESNTKGKIAELYEEKELSESNKKNIISINIITLLLTLLLENAEN